MTKIKPRTTRLHAFARRADFDGARAWWAAHADAAKRDINVIDDAGRSALAYAVSQPASSAAFVAWLLDRGANFVACGVLEGGLDYRLLGMALNAGNPDVVSLLIERGENPCYRRAGGYDALIDAVHGRDLKRDPRLLELLRLLIRHQVPLDDESEWRESGLRSLAKAGRFDAVKLLLEAGAPRAQLDWTPLIEAVAIGTTADVERELQAGGDLEARDVGRRTAWDMALLCGGIEKCQLLLDWGADRSAVAACAKPAIFFAIESRRVELFAWCVERGMSLDVRDQFGNTPLVCAIETGEVALVDAVLARGADVDTAENGQSALRLATTATIAQRLLAAGADPKELSSEARREILGLGAARLDELLLIEPQQYAAGKRRRFGTANPTRMQEPFWEAMIRAGVSAYHAAQHFSDDSHPDAEAVWCAERFGQSITFLPDGRIVQIAGEHEDYYDPDFCIYNDVFVHHPSGAIEIFGYPRELFPPTDFHTATLMGNDIVIIGSLGYREERQFGKTAVFRLDVQSFQITPVETTGAMPGWIYKHRADLRSDGRIRVSGGTIARSDDEHVDNTDVYVLDVSALKWERA